MTKSGVVLVVILALLFISGLASQAGAEEVLACYKKNNGQLRIVNDHSECRPSELPITLNQSATCPVETECYCFIAEDASVVGGESFMLSVGLTKNFPLDGYSALGSADFPEDEHAVVSGGGFFLPFINLYVINLDWTYGDILGRAEFASLRFHYNTQTLEAELYGVAHRYNWANPADITEHHVYANLTRIDCPEQ